MWHVVLNTFDKPALRFWVVRRYPIQSPDLFQPVRRAEGQRDISTGLRDESKRATSLHTHFKMQPSQTSGHDGPDEQSITPVHADETGSVDVARGPSEDTSLVAEQQLRGEDSVSHVPSTFHTGEISTGEAGPTVYAVQQPEQPTEDQNQDKREEECGFVEAEAGSSAASKVDATATFCDSPVCTSEAAQLVAQGVPSSNVSYSRPPFPRAMSSVESYLSPLPAYSSCQSPCDTTIPDTHAPPPQDSTSMIVLSRASGAQQVRPITQRIASYSSQQVDQPGVQVGTLPSGHNAPRGLTIQTNVTPLRVFPTNEGSVTPTAPPAYSPRSPNAAADTEAYDSVYGEQTDNQSHQRSSQDLVDEPDVPLLFGLSDLFDEGEPDRQEESKSVFPPDRKA